MYSNSVIPKIMEEKHICRKTGDFHNYGSLSFRFLSFFLAFDRTLLNVFFHSLNGRGAINNVQNSKETSRIEEISSRRTCLCERERKRKRGREKASNHKYSFYASYIRKHLSTFHLSLLFIHLFTNGKLLIVLSQHIFFFVESFNYAGTKFDVIFECFLVTKQFKKRKRADLFTLCKKSIDNNITRK